MGKAGVMSSVVFRYQENQSSPYDLRTLTLSGNMAPVFDNALGMKFHSIGAEKPEYSLTSRYYPTTKFTWVTENTTETNRDTIKAFYSTYLDEGFYDFSIIDHRKRILFEASWNNWAERWNRRYGGSFNVQYGIESSFGWTPEMFDAWLMIDDSYKYYIASAYMSAGTLLKYAADTNVLSLYGWCVRLTGDDGSAKQTGAATVLPVSWDSTRPYNSISMFCQYRCGSLGSGRLDLMEISRGDNYIRISLEEAPSSHYLKGTVINAGDSVTVEAAAGVEITLTADTWYDVAITYDSVNSEIKVMWAAASNSSFTRFLDGMDSLVAAAGVVQASGMASYLPSAVYPNQTIYNNFRLLAESAVDTLDENEKAYIQNAMVFDGYLSAMQFNMIRKLCFIWNSKTSGVNPR